MVIERANSADIGLEMQDYVIVRCLWIHQEAVAYLELFHYECRMCNYHRPEKIFGMEEQTAGNPLSDAYDRQRNDGKMVRMLHEKIENSRECLLSFKERKET